MKQSVNRLIPLFKEDGLNKLNASKVAIVGLGGVGATVALTLARCGIGNFILCDFDTIEESNINRQVFTDYSNIGLLKTDELAKEINRINPSANIELISNKVDNSIFDNDIDIIVDAIDDIKSKEQLIKESVNRNINIISSMGAGNKLDPKKVIITKLQKTTYDPLAKVLRHNLKGINIDVCSSTEESIKCDMVSSYLPVVSTFSLLIADYVIKYLLNKEN